MTSPSQPSQPTQSPGPEDLGFELPAAAKSSWPKILVVVLLVVGGVFAVGYTKHHSGRGGSGAGMTTAEGGPLRVEVFNAKELSSDHALALPGVVRPLEEAKIYSRSQGYVRKWLVDIGDKVKEGQLLAEIDTPELDAQLAQARAQLAQARASVKQASAQRDFTKSSSSRYETLADQKLVSKAAVEQQQAQAATDEASVTAAESNVTAQEANVRRLQELQGYSKVTAPFAGTITARTIDRGTLVGEGGATPMFTLAATDPVRIFVDVPQSVAPSVRAETAASVAVREYAGRAFAGKVTRSSGALDPELHTMSTEVQVPNADGALLPGMYVQVSLTLPVPHRVLEIPATALYTDAQGTRVATVDAQNKIKMVPITIERDTGASLWVASGLNGSERIVKIAVPSALDGDPVEVVQAAAPAGSGSEGAQQARASGSGQKSSP
ncbi:MAG TPA: efflux RND transporter periplasmic adaptor subunit [Kofleriaceae bacterium]|jgi:RND family efflux transporter MFP subunit|nr:efflux RND transporter periplasmic adaptor subunit [Kofleriaceae bacterium]